MTICLYIKDCFSITTDKSIFDIPSIHNFLTNSHWAKGISKEDVQKSIDNSLNFGLFVDNRQIGFARIVTDYVTFGYLCDVYVLEKYRNHGLGRWLIECCHNHPTVHKLKKVMLVTSTAPWLYERTGYVPLNKPNFVWQKLTL